jgi:hypothetical protein
MQKNRKYEKNAEYCIFTPGLGAAPRQGVENKNMQNTVKYAKYAEYRIL